MHESTNGSWLALASAIAVTTAATPLALVAQNDLPPPAKLRLDRLSSFEHGLDEPETAAAQQHLERLDEWLATAPPR